MTDKVLEGVNFNSETQKQQRGPAWRVRSRVHEHKKMHVHGARRGIFVVHVARQTPLHDAR